MTVTDYTRRSTMRPAGGLALVSLDWLRCAIETRRERRALAQLDRMTLIDIGLDPDQVARETARPFWDLPSRQGK